MRRAGETFGYGARAQHAALHDAATLLGGPTSDHRLAGQMQDGIKTVHVGRFARHEAARALIAWLAGKRNDFPSLRHGKTRHLPADESRSPCDSEPHGQKVRRIQL